MIVKFTVKAPVAVVETVVDGRIPVHPTGTARLSGAPTLTVGWPGASLHS
jgi:hypothetical protein